MTREEFMEIALERYDVLEDGTVVRISPPLGRFPKTKEVRTFVNDKGYVFISLCVNRVKKTLPLHRIVAYKYLGPANGLEVNHLNGNKLDNRITNLEYTTREENRRHFTDRLLPMRKELKLCRLHQTPLTDAGKCLQKGCKYS